MLHTVFNVYIAVFIFAQINSIHCMNYPYNFFVGIIHTIFLKPIFLQNRYTVEIGDNIKATPVPKVHFGTIGCLLGCFI